MQSGSNEDSSKIKIMPSSAKFTKELHGSTDSASVGAKKKQLDRHLQKKRKNSDFKTTAKKAKLSQNGSSVDSKPKKLHGKFKKKDRNTKSEVPSDKISDHSASVERKEEHRSKHQCDASLRITNLPNYINYTMLREAIPSASRLRLFKKSAKRHAFANFANMEDFTNAVSRLEELEFDGVKPSYKQVVRRKKDRIKTEDELENEFPLAKSITINTKKDGTNKGSCLLEFECKEDLQVVLDACQNKVIGGRPVNAVVGLHFNVRPNPTTNIDIKICKLPTTVGDDKIRGRFPPGSIVEYCSVPINSLKRNVFVTLKNTKQNEHIIRELKKKGIDEHHLKIKRWYKKKLITKAIKLKPDTAEKEKKSKKLKHKKMDESENCTEQVSDEMRHKSKKLKHKKMDESENCTEQVSDEMRHKSKKLKHKKMDDSENCTEAVPVLKKMKPKKFKHEKMEICD
ncbi:unnamed protein product [Trichobilharzia szidati]|nr:unnamed protein product [Trichobilharzia szidati]